MRDYAETLKSMRICLNVDRDSNCLSECFGCNYISHDNHVMDMVRDAADAIEELLAAVPKWISVEERLPEERHSVLCYCPQNNCTYTAVWNGKAWIHFASIEPVFYPVTHWMPLPEPPEEVRDG